MHCKVDGYRFVWEFLLYLWVGVLILLGFHTVCVGTPVKTHVRSNAGLDHGNLLESKGHVSTYSA